MSADALIAAYRSPVGQGLPVDATHRVEHRNMSCGDSVVLGWTLTEGVITAIGHECVGCVMHKASTSILCKEMAGRAVSEIPELLSLVDRICDADNPMPEGLSAELRALGDIRAYPTRRNCVRLSWQALAELASAASKRPAE
jgi:nitrogen fixation NifU-like protein